MSATYWAQWSSAELKSMQGIEEDEEYRDDTETEENSESCCSSGCMDCLGLSWRDFI